MSLQGGVEGPHNHYWTTHTHIDYISTDLHTTTNPHPHKHPHMCAHAQERRLTQTHIHTAHTHIHAAHEHKRTQTHATHIHTHAQRNTLTHATRHPVNERRANTHTRIAYSDPPRTQPTHGQGVAPPSRFRDRATRHPINERRSNTHTHARASRIAYSHAGRSASHTAALGHAKMPTLNVAHRFRDTLTRATRHPVHEQRANTLSCNTRIAYSHAARSATHKPRQAGWHTLIASETRPPAPRDTRP